MKSPARDQALRFLEHRLHSGEGGGGEALPSLARLSQAAGVSLVSMWKAVDVLKRKGVLRAVRGGRITLAGRRAAPDRIPDAPELKWEKARAGLLADITAGRYAAGERLPDQAGLCVRYAVAYPTLRKALQALEASGDLRREGNGFRVPARKGGTAFSSILLIAAAGVDGGFGVFRDRGRDLLEKLESECIDAKVRLKVFKAEPGRVPALLQDLKREGGELGCILWPGEWPGRPETLAKIEDILAALAARKSRIAILDEMGGFPLSGKYASTGRVRVMTIAAHNAGLVAARHLLALGHRKIAYLTPYRTLPWSTMRYEGIRRAFAMAGLPGKALLFNRENDRDYNRVYSLGAFGESRPDEAMAWMSGFLRERPRLLAEVKFRILERYVEEQINRDMEPVFREAARDPEITAWIGANDATALAASRFLQGLGKEVPRDISILGFDNTPAAIESGLTSYDFRTARFPGAMLRFLLHPDRRSRAADPDCVEADGALIARPSTAAVRGI